MNNTPKKKNEGRGLEGVSQVAMTEKQWKGKQTEAGGRADGQMVHWAVNIEGKNNFQRRDWHPPQQKGTISQHLPPVLGLR